MEVNNGIIIDGVLHELIKTNSDDCSLYGICVQQMLICHALNGDIFTNRGRVADIKIDKED